ncbi:uncharacterized protein N7503_011850 [Penicillium pulvis]|uniref:uncharacterized protein n=1 Tax=Penicillium pulvis TaxID=1562058 RepID=UPI002547A900|nr:uncharacterized protein N7503_011850 [Penicillium pulvis]KAJ5786638.1 hypothetical protein N7503_011850 [Penicillium pulvis]
MRRDVVSELVFWARPENQPFVSDFTKEKPEVCMAAMKQEEEKHMVTVHDVRGQESQFTLDGNGFQYAQHDIPGMDRAEDPTHVETVIIPQTEELVRNITGATKTITFAHRVRCLAADENLLANNRAPAHSVHSDFSVPGAFRMLETIIPDPEERQQLLKGRVEIINVWRPLKKVERDPLAVCDWTTLDQNDIIRHRLVLPTGWNELGKYVFNPSQKWCYLSSQQPQEALIFRQFDSRKADKGGMSLPHTAFVDPDSADGPARESIEIKMFAFSDVTHVCQ